MSLLYWQNNRMIIYFRKQKQMEIMIFHMIQINLRQNSAEAKFVPYHSSLYFKPFCMHFSYSGSSLSFFFSLQSYSQKINW